VASVKQEIVSKTIEQHVANTLSTKNNRKITVDFVKQLREELLEFNTFASSGMPSKVSD
jgi:hypothetical protein